MGRLLFGTLPAGGLDCVYLLMALNHRHFKIGLRLSYDEFVFISRGLGLNDTMHFVIVQFKLLGPCELHAVDPIELIL